MAIAVARVFQDDDYSNTLVICPRRLERMWRRETAKYALASEVLTLGRVIKELPRMPRFATLIIDESHNFRNREGKRYRAVRAYIERNEPRVILLTATPYNKHFTDLSGQLRLFIDESADLRVRPERLFEQWRRQGYTEADFIADYQVSPRSLRAFEESPFAEDWRDLMRLFLVRRTRRFIQAYYAQYDPKRRRYYVYRGDKRHYFPKRVPRTVTFGEEAGKRDEQYARLYSDEVVALIESLRLPRYGLALYLDQTASKQAKGREKTIISNLNRAGRRLIGFCRTNLFKRLESSGYSFLLSVRRHIMRNMIVLHALENDLPVPIGTQYVSTLDPTINDADVEATEEATEIGQEPGELAQCAHLGAFRDRAAVLYKHYRTELQRYFDWLPAAYFKPKLAEDLRRDAEQLAALLDKAGEWDPEQDSKLAALEELLTKKHGGEKVLVFTQFADTAVYLGEQLRKRGMKDFDVVTGQTGDTSAIVRRFSPKANDGLQPGEKELRVLISTDTLAEGQNLQDCYIVVNYDLPWAIIRLIQRAGRVDRIGQEHDTIYVYSFLPAEGVEKVIRLRTRLTRRLQENQEVVGTDETFFDEKAADKLRDIYTEKAGSLDDDEDEDVDLSSIALQVWKSASESDRKAALALGAMSYATRPHVPKPDDPDGVITYMRFPDGTDALVRLDSQGNVVSQSLTSLFQAAACSPDTPALERLENHHELVRRAVEYAHEEQRTLAGRLGSLRSTRRKVYERLKDLRQNPPDNLPLSTAQIERLLELLIRYPLTSRARDTLARRMRLGIKDADLAALAWQLYEEERLVDTSQGAPEPGDPVIVCSLGLRRIDNGSGGQEDEPTAADHSTSA